MTDPDDVAAVREFADQVAANIETVIFGKRREIEYLLVALLCQGHVLIEDVPGTGKTMLARSAAGSMGLAFKRLQCTPDLLPNDVTGLSVYNQKAGEFVFHPGPVFVNILLADEINRATPRTQSALLEAMQEGQVTMEGSTRPLPQPFLVLATQNPIEYEGTFPLPEAQLDRFLLRMPLGYPEEDAELQMVHAQQDRHPVEVIGQVVDGSRLLALRQVVSHLHVDSTLERYILAIVRATRRAPELEVGASPRGTLALYRTSQALAAVRGRDHVLPDDVKEMARLVLPHRLAVRIESDLRGSDASAVVEQILAETPLDLEGSPGVPSTSA